MKKKKPRGFFRKIYDYIRIFQRLFKQHNVTAFSAQIAFFFTLSIFPFLIFLVSLLASFDIDYNMVTNILQSALPSDMTASIVDYIKTNVAQNSSAVLPVSLVVMLFSSSRAVTSIMRALNVVYHVEETRNYFYTRLLGMIYLLILTVLIIISLVSPEWGYRFNEAIRPYIPISISVGILQIFTLVRTIVIPVGFLIFFTSIYVFLPNRKIKFTEVYLGAIFGIVASLISTYAFTYFIETFTNYSIVYGSVSAIIILMLWLYLLGYIIVFGAELNVVFLLDNHDPDEDSVGPSLVDKLKYSVKK